VAYERVKPTYLKETFYKFELLQRISDTVMAFTHSHPPRTFNATDVPTELLTSNVGC